MNFWPIVKKDLKVLLKDKGALVVLFILPIMFISVMSFALKPVYSGSGEKAIEIPVVSQDSSKEAKDFVASLRKIEGLKIVSETKDGRLTEEKAADLVKNGKYPMALIIPKEFGTKVANSEKTNLVSYEDPAQTNTNSVLIKAIEGVSKTFSVQFTISHLVDDQVKGIKETVDSKLKDIQDSYDKKFKNELADISKKTGITLSVPASTNEAQSDNMNYDSIKSDLLQKAESSLVEPSITVQSKIDSSGKAPRPDSFQQNVPGYTVMFAFFIVMFAGRSFIYERNEGTFLRILSAPVSKWSLFAGKMLPNYIIGLVQTIVMFSFGHFVFGMSLGNSLLGLLAISMCMIWASTSLGMLIASLVRTESQVTGFSMLVVLTLAALGGTMVPLFIMPDLMQKIALITPHAWALSGYQDLLVRGMHFSDIYTNLLALFGFGLVFVLISIWRMRFDN